MSEIIKLNVKSKKLNVLLKDQFQNENFETEKEEDYFRNQLKQNYEHGYTEGHKAALDKLEKEYSEKLLAKFNVIENIAAKMEAALIEYELDFEKTVVKLAIELSEKIIKREISQEPIITEVLKDSLRRVLGSNDIRVKINPADYDVLNKESNNLLMEDTFTKIKFEPDEGIEQGGCYVETEIGNVDARITSQLNEMKKQLESIFTHSVS
jgi:flagellar assembly protein FliH